MFLWGNFEIILKFSLYNFDIVYFEMSNLTVITQWEISCAIVDYGVKLQK